MGAFSETTCTSALLDGQQGLDAFIAFNAKDYGKLISIMTSPNLHLGPAASNNLISPGPNSNSKTVQVAEGVYIYLGTCGGWNSVLDPSNVGVSMQVLIVPDGIGSLSPALTFGVPHSRPASTSRACSRCSGPSAAVRAARGTGPRELKGPFVRSQRMNGPFSSRRAAGAGNAARRGGSRCRRGR